MFEIRYFVAPSGQQPFAEWFADLEPVARAKVTRALARMEQGNLSNVKPVGGGVLEFKIDLVRVTGCISGRDGSTLIVLLTGGTKKRQQRDIATAIEYWRSYKQSKRPAR